MKDYGDKMQKLIYHHKIRAYSSEKEDMDSEFTNSC